MIVDPDFLDHWRTGMLADALGDPMAPIYVLRLWGHCQERKSDRFAMPARGLKAQCRYPGDADTFEAALIEAKFIERDGDEIRVFGWAEKNASLLAAWANGGRGGRPKKTETEPTENQRVSQREPDANQVGTYAEPIRVDKSREEVIPPTLRVAPPPKRKKTAMPADFGVSERVSVWAAEKGYGRLAEHLDAFRRKVAANGYTAVSWDDKFMEAIREDWAKLRGRTQNGVAPAAEQKPVEVWRPPPPLTEAELAQGREARLRALSAVKRLHA